MTDFKILQGNDVMNMLKSIYMDGLMSGAASTALTAGATPELADEFAQRFVTEMHRDPAAMLLVEQEITERLTGQNPGPKTIKLGDLG